MFGGPFINAITIVGTIVAILATCFSGISHLTNKVIGNSLMPLSNKIENLIQSLNRLNVTFDRQQNKIEQIDRRLDHHDVRLGHHDEKLDVLNREVFGKDDHK